MAWVEQRGNRTWRVRYRRDDGTIGAIHGFATKTAATTHANTLESEQREGRFIDPAAGKITLAAWSQDWLGALDVAIRTEDVYRSLLRRHILPRWGDHGLADISGIKAAAGPKSCAARGYSPVTVAAVHEAAVAAAGRRRRGTAHPGQPHPRPPTADAAAPNAGLERVWATPGEVLAVADNAARLPDGGLDAAVLIVTAALDRGPLGRARRAATPQHPPRRHPAGGYVRHRPRRSGR